MKQSIAKERKKALPVRVFHLLSSSEKEKW
jgi:hypothetical protein